MSTDRTSAREVRGRRERLDHQAVEPRVAIIERRQVHACVPAPQQLHVDGEPFGHGLVEHHPGARRAPQEPLLEIFSGHHAILISALASGHVRRDDRHGSRRHTRDAQCLPERFRSDRRQALPRSRATARVHPRTETPPESRAVRPAAPASTAACCRRRYPAYLNSVSTLDTSPCSWPATTCNDISPAVMSSASRVSARRNAPAARARVPHASVTVVRRTRRKFSSKRARRGRESRPPFVAHEPDVPTMRREGGGRRCRSGATAGARPRDVNIRYGSRHPVVVKSSARIPMYASSRISTSGSRRRARSAALIPASSPCAAASSYPDVPLTCPARKSPSTRLASNERGKLGRLDEIVFDARSRAATSPRLRAPATRGRALPARRAAGSSSTRSRRSHLRRAPPAPRTRGAAPGRGTA